MNENNEFSCYPIGLFRIDSMAFHLWVMNSSILRGFKLKRGYELDPLFSINRIVEVVLLSNKKNIN